MSTDVREPAAAGRQIHPGLLVVEERTSPEPLELRAQRLLASLPYALRMPVTRQRFPHVVNRIAADWEVPARLLRLMDELLIDQRGGREGFPFETVLELTSLREYFLNELHAGMRERLTARATGVW
jgi:hypothetical protein